MDFEHPLYNEWTFWFDSFSNKSSETYGTKIIEIGKCSTAEEFWGIYNAIPTMETMEIGSDISLFRKDIKPIWEDKANQGGGRLQIILTNTTMENCQQYWRDIVCFLLFIFIHYCK